MEGIKCEVVKFRAIDGFIYRGLLYRAKESKKTIIHIHGACGNMLSFSSLIDLASSYLNCGYNMLTFDLRAHDCIAEGTWYEDKSPNPFFYYVGGSLETFESCIIDIESAINFVKSFSNEIILQGHSMGCERILTYQITQGTNYNTILLSPCDGHQLQVEYIYPKTIETEISELGKYGDNELLPADSFGVNRDNGEKYTIPMYKKALLSILTGYAMKVLRLDRPFEFFCPISCLCVLGTLDLLQTNKPEATFNLLKEKFTSFEGYTINGDHEMIPAQNELVSIVCDWLKRKSSTLMSP